MEQKLFWHKEAFKEHGLDETDCRILLELDANCRQSNAEIGKKLRLNKSVVNYRINKLLELGIITRFYAVVDAPRMGFQSFRVYIKFSTPNQAKRTEVIEFVAKQKQIWFAGPIDGDVDFGLLFLAKDLYEFRDFWFGFLEKFQDRIQQAIVSLYTRLFTYQNAYLSPKPPKDISVQVVGGRFGHIAISQTDQLVLAYLSDNARESVVEIARRLELTPMIVRYAMKKFENLGIILAYRAQIDFGKLGYTMYKFHLHLKNRSKYNALLAYAQSCPHISYVDEAIGYADFEGEMFVQKYDEFKAIRQDLLGIAGDTLHRYDHFIYEKFLDIKFYPY